MWSRQQKGFSLIELLIVIAIILIIASIAIPSLLNARRSANEASAVGSIRAINTAQISYMSAYPANGYATTLVALAGSDCTPPSPASACLIDSQTASGTKNGYTFVISGASGTPASTHQIIATPIAGNQTGVRSYCSFSDGVVRAQVSPITSCDNSVTPLQ